MNSKAGLSPFQAFRWGEVRSKKEGKNSRYIVLVFSLALCVPRSQLSERLQQSTKRFIIKRFLSLSRSFPRRDCSGERRLGCLFPEQCRLVTKVLSVISFICYSIRFHLIFFFFCSSVTRTVSGSYVDILPTNPRSEVYFAFCFFTIISCCFVEIK